MYLQIKNTNVPICKNCIYFIKYVNKTLYENENIHLSMCKKYGTINLVSGKIKYELASKCRNSYYMCTHKGIHFIENK